MEVFRDMIIRGSREQLSATVDEIERSLPAGWIRDKDAEAWVMGRAPAKALVDGREVDGFKVDPSAKPIYCFTDRGDHPLACAIYLTEHAPDSISTSNVVPLNKKKFSFNEYNSVLKNFFDHVVLPCSRKTGAEVELTADQADLGRWLSDSAVSKLRVFSSMANKSTGASHPRDQERWLDFIVAAYREETGLEASILRRWLIEVDGWPPEVADQLAAEYEFGGELLAFSEGGRAGV